MKDSDLKKIIELSYVGGGFIPSNEKARELSETCVKGEVIQFMEVTARDLKLHQGYMSLLGYIWDYLTPQFQKRVPKKYFYQWLKHLQGKYKVLYEFQDGSKFIEYESISFGNMSNKRFIEFIKEQLPFIYEDVIYPLYSDEIAKNIIENIEEEWMKFLVKLA